MYIVLLFACYELPRVNWIWVVLKSNKINNKQAKLHIQVVAHTL